MGVGCPFPLQETFPTQELNPHLLYHLHWQADSLLPSHQESPSRKEENIKLVYAECQSTPLIWNSSLIGHLKPYGMPWSTTVWDICNIHLYVTSELHSLSWGKGMTVEAGGSLNFFSGCQRNSYSLLAGTAFQSKNFCHSALYLFSSLSNLNSINIWVFLITTENSYADLLFKNFNWRVIALQYLSWFLPYNNVNQLSPTYVPSLLTSHPSRFSQYCIEIPVLYSNFPLAICFTYGNVYVLLLRFQFVPPSLTPSALESDLFLNSLSNILKSLSAILWESLVWEMFCSPRSPTAVPNPPLQS